jgi:hypothetical protein
MAMIKGKSQHVMPDESGWCVIDEASQQVIWHFNTQEEAIAHATEQATITESEVLIHTTFSPALVLSTVPLPQREVLPDRAQANTSFQNEGHSEENTEFDPMLGYDAYYFEL